MIIFITILLFIIALVILFWQISNLVSVFFGSPYVKARRDIAKKTLELVGLKKGEVFYELGCGTGEVLIEAAKMGAKAVGFEISPFYFLIAKLRTWKYPNIKIRFQDIRRVDLQKADVVYVYLLPEFLEKLSPKFKKELKKSSRLVSIGFPVPDLNNCRTFRIDNRKIFIYSPSSRSA